MLPHLWCRITHSILRCIGIYANFHLPRRHPCTQLKVCNNCLVHTRIPCHSHNSWKIIPVFPSIHQLVLQHPWARGLKRLASIAGIIHWTWSGGHNIATFLATYASLNMAIVQVETLERQVNHMQNEAERNTFHREDVSQKTRDSVQGRADLQLRQQQLEYTHKIQVAFRSSSYPLFTACKLGVLYCLLLKTWVSLCLLMFHEIRWQVWRHNFQCINSSPALRAQLYCCEMQAWVETSQALWLKDVPSLNGIILVHVSHVEELLFPFFDTHLMDTYRWQNCFLSTSVVEICNPGLHFQTSWQLTNPDCAN